VQAVTVGCALRPAAVTERPLRLAALVSHPIQYFAPLYRELAARPDVDLTVYFCSRQGVDEYVDREFGQRFSWDVPLLAGYHYQVLPAMRGDRGVGGFWSLTNPTIVTELRRGAFDALWVHGYMHATNWIAYLAASAFRVPVLLRGESNLLGRRPALRQAVKSGVLRALFYLAAGCLYVGSRNREYYQHYGVPRQKLYFAPYSVDNAFFRRQAELLAPRRAELKAGFGIPPDLPVVVFVGKLVAKKQPLRLLAAYARARRRAPCALLVAGSGPLEKRFREQIAADAIPDVHLAGFLNQGQISQAYAVADVLALPSTWETGDDETWGLAVNEAMNFGVPVVITDQVGCAGDLVQDGRNGFVVPHDSTEALASALSILAGNAALRRTFGARSLATIGSWGLEATADGVVAAARAVSARRMAAARCQVYDSNSNIV